MPEIKKNQAQQGQKSARRLDSVPAKAGKRKRRLAPDDPRNTASTQCIHYGVRRAVIEHRMGLWRTLHKKAADKSEDHLPPSETSCRKGQPFRAYPTCGETAIARTLLPAS